MKKKLLIGLTALFILLTSFKGQCIPAVLYDGTGAPAEYKLVAMTLAGIVNRETPRLYLLNVYETWSYNQTDEMWRDIYAADGGAGFTVIQNINELVEHFSEDINGAITYDATLTYGNFEGQNFRWQAEVAAMIGGLTNSVPIPYSNTSMQVERPDSVQVPDHYHGQDTIVISARLELESHPWNNPALSQEERYFLILDWALDTLLDRTNPRKFYLREITDWAVNQRMFQLNLAGTHSLQFSSLTDEKAEKIEQVMTYLRDCHPDEIFHVYGWMRPEPLVQWISGWGGSFHETLLSNLSWHHIFPADQNFDYNRPSAIEPEEVELQDKYYVIFIGSEGDAGNWNAGFQSGAWHSAMRGDVPVGWGFNLHFFKEFPFMGQYYFRTASENDGFISVTNPMGYAYADMFPESFLPDAIEKSIWKVQQYNIPSVYAYKHYNGAGVSTYRGITISNNYDFDKLGAFSEATGTELTFLFDPALATQFAYTQYGGLLYNHVNDNTFYADFSDLNAAASSIVSKLVSKPRPGFLLAGYQRFRQDGTHIGAGNSADITLPRLKNLMDIIKSDEQIGEQIEFVTPEKFTWLLQKSLDPTGIASLAAALSKKEVHAWINTSGQLEVNIETKTPEIFIISIYNSSGELIKRKREAFPQGNTATVLSLPPLPSGLYILNVAGSSTYFSKKIIF